MKKIFLFLLMLFPINIFAATTATKGVESMTYIQCFNYQEEIENATGAGYFSDCLKVTCDTGIWQTYSFFSGSMLTCANGNTDYYKYIYSNGCSKYTGSCQSNGQKKENYCGVVYGYDCSKTSNGMIYVPKLNPDIDQPTSSVITNKSTTKKSGTTKKTTTTTTKAKDSNNYLSQLIVKDNEKNYNVEFNKEVLTYNLEINKNITSLIIEAMPEMITSTIIIENNENIDITKPIIITVTSEDQNTRQYTINLSYKKLSNNTFLKVLKIENYELDFNKEVYYYKLLINKDDTELKIHCEVEDEKSFYVISGNEKLENGSKITIEVNSENEEKAVYEIEIEKKEKKKNTVLIVFIIIIIVGVIGYVLFKLLKNILPAKEDKNYDYE